MKSNEWKIEYQIPDIPSSLLEAGFPPLLSAVLSLRGITTAEQAHAFLSDSSSVLYDPFLMEGMDRAVERVRLALQRGEKIAVYGDYDVDGITSSCLLWDYLTAKGAECLLYIPDRYEEGYGLNCEALDKFREAGVTLVITVDCGITAVEEADYARSLGIDMVITDHHECKGCSLPKAVAVVDPRQDKNRYPNADLAGVGVAFKLVCACEKDEQAMLERYADLVAIGTISDVMPLIGENRSLVRLGLEKLKNSPRPGLEAMMQEAGLDPRQITATSIGYILAPRLNAAGRLDKATRAADLVRTVNKEEAKTIASFLCALNRRRQEIENEIWKEAVAMLGHREADAPIVLASPSWDQGVIGIAASRLADYYAVPTIMICLNGETGKGSCRSYGGFNLYEALSACSEYLLSFGGHALAAGLNIEKDRIDDFRRALTEYYRNHMPASQCEVDCDLLIADPALLSVENVRSLDLLEPYGNGNSKPILCILGLKVISFSNVGNGKHLKMRLSFGESLFDAIFFSHTAKEFGLHEGDLVDVAFSPQINDFRGITSVQFIVSALRRHDSTVLCEDILNHGCTYRKAAARHCPERGDFIQVWKGLAPKTRLGPDCASVLQTCPPGMSEERYCLCLSVFHEAGLLSGEGSSIFGAEKQASERKVDLESTALMHSLRKSAAT